MRHSYQMAPVSGPNCSRSPLELSIVGARCVLHVYRMSRKNPFGTDRERRIIIDRRRNECFVVGLRIPFEIKLHYRLDPTCIEFRIIFSLLFIERKI